MVCPQHHSFPIAPDPRRQLDIAGMMMIVPRDSALISALAWPRSSMTFPEPVALKSALKRTVAGQPGRAHVPVLRRRPASS